MTGPWSFRELGPNVWELVWRDKETRFEVHATQVKPNDVRGLPLMVNGLNAGTPAPPDRGDGTSRTASHRPVPAAHRELPASEPAPVANPTIANGIELARRAYEETAHE